MAGGRDKQTVCGPEQGVPPSWSVSVEMTWYPNSTGRMKAQAEKLLLAARSKALGPRAAQEGRLTHSRTWDHILSWDSLTWVNEGQSFSIEFIVKRTNMPSCTTLSSPSTEASPHKPLPIFQWPSRMCRAGHGSALGPSLVVVGGKNATGGKWQKPSSSWLR